VAHRMQGSTATWILMHNDPQGGSRRVWLREQTVLDKPVERVGLQCCPQHVL
jgi:hypothetical protein